MINRVIASRYKILERVGIGGMAEVYKAQDEVLKRIDAVKVLLPQFASDPTFAARFRQEAQAAANLSSPYIVNIYDWGLDGETYYIVMEYVRGVDLKTAIAQRGAIEQRKVAQIASQICSGLAVAHGYDIIHRDIKPQNIMIQPDGNIKIMDFGVARAGNSTMTQTGSVLGTANYVSPEQAQGKIPTAASDLYSLGILMYEAVTGRLPFEGPDAISVALKQVNEMPVPPSQYNPAIDPNLEAIILKAMEKNPEDRFLSADEMRNAINGYLNGTPTQILQGAGMPTAVLNGAATRVIPVGETDKTSVMTAAADKNGVRHPDNDNKKKMSGKKKAIIAIIVVALIAAIGGTVYALTAGSGTKVPNVVGQTQQVAEQKLTDAGYVAKVTNDYSDTVQSGNVISQTPVADSQLAKGETVTIVVSEGSKPKSKVTVPDLSKMTPEEAQKALSDVNLVMATGDSVSDNEIDVGHVAKQSPDANSSVDEGSTVTIYLSKGAEQVSVPSVTGFSEAKATSTLNNAGFYVTTKYAYSDTVDSGVVMAQSPSGGNTADSGSTVTITVSQGPQETTVTVPSFTGMTLDQAKSAITSAGLTFGGSFGDSSSTAVVTDQNPKAGTSAAKGASVSLEMGAA